MLVAEQAPNRALEPAHSAPPTMLNPIVQSRLKMFSELIQNNNTAALASQIDGIKMLLNKFDDDELRRDYYMVLAAIAPEQCIAQKESSTTDNYWMSFWSYLAYIKAGRVAEAENLLFSMDRFTNYPGENTLLLATAGALMQGKTGEATELLYSVTGSFSVALKQLAHSLYLILDPMMAQTMGASETQCTFCLVNFLGQEDPREKARRMAAEEQARIAQMEKQRAEEMQRQYQAEMERRMNPTVYDMPCVIFNMQVLYTGCTRNGVPNGKGTARFGNGDTYDGEFANGVMNGHGVYTSYADGTIYDGDFVQGAQHGRGTYTYKNGARYEGDVNNGIYYGKGCYHFPDGTQYEGDFVNGQFHGHGVFTWSNGDKYDGEWYGGVKHGRGVFRFANGKTMEGIWQNDKAM